MDLWNNICKIIIQINVGNVYIPSYDNHLQLLEHIKTHAEQLIKVEIVVLAWPSNLWQKQKHKKSEP